ncbi:hypothetical protein EFO98_08005 [Lactiplantibacillus argentoratensis]|nr:hypothetical protein [Lactiplantibacillus argentoratensis]
MKLNRRIGTWVSWLAVLSLAVVFAGCSQQTSSSKKSSKAQKIVLYSNSLSAGRGEWLKKEAAKAGFTITPVSMGGGEVINRIISEKNKPVADVVYGSSQFGLAKLEQKGLLKKFSVDWEKDLPKSDVQGNGYYYPLTKQIIVQIADSKTPKSDLPSAWLDLTASPAKYKDMVPNKTGINGQTNQMVIATLLNKYKDTSASDGVSPEAWPAIKNYFKNGKQLGNPDKIMPMKRRICCGVRHQKLSNCTASGSKKTGKPLSSSVKKSLAWFTKSWFCFSSSAGEKLAVEKSNFLQSTLQRLGIFCKINLIYFVRS